MSSPVSSIPNLGPASELCAFAGALCCLAWCVQATALRFAISSKILN